MNKKIVHDALILTVFTVVIGFILGLVYGYQGSDCKGRRGNCTESIPSSV